MRFAFRTKFRLTVGGAHARASGSDSAVRNAFKLACS